MDDLISRQAAINKISERQRKLIYCFGFENDMVKIMDIAKSIVIAMPSAQHERKRGKWKIREDMYGDTEATCSECGFETVVDQPGNNLHMLSDLHFCPSCGADMMEGQDGD